jgi:hypothetical protein
MKYFLLNAILLLSIIGCKKPANTQAVSNVNGNWSLVLDNSSQPMNGVIGKLEMDNLNNIPKNFLVMSGESLDDKYSLIIWMKMSTTQPSTGHYSLTDTGNRITLDKYSNPSGPLYFEYEASLYYPRSTLSFDIVSYNSTTRAISATFSGSFSELGTSAILHTVTNGTMNGVLP